MSGPTASRRRRGAVRVVEAPVATAIAHYDAVQLLQKQVRELQRRSRRWKRAETVVLRPTLDARLSATLLYRLSGNADLAVLWLRQRIRAVNRAVRAAACCLGSLDIEAMERELGAHATVQAAMADLADPRRQSADRWLIESLVAENISKQNSKGLAVPPDAVVSMYIRLWRLRPMAPGTAAELNQLESDVGRRANWGRSFRRRWSLEHGRLRNIRALSRADIGDRAALFVRWSQWLLQVIGRDSNVVVVNLDETGMSNVKEGRHGTVIARNRQHALDNVDRADQRYFSRCTLLAAIADDLPTQAALPQVFLPRQAAAASPSRATLRAVEDAGAPAECWHGSGGFMSAPLLRQYLTKLRAAVRSVRPGWKVVVAMDAANAHTNLKVLRHARRLGMHVLFVPARMTWMLQPLDTHVFAVLKRRMRQLVMEQRMAAARGRITAAAVLRCAAIAAKQVLSSGDWRGVMARAGLSRGDEALRPSLQEILQGKDVTQRPPTAAELSELLGCSLRKAAAVHRLTVLPATAMTDVTAAMPSETLAEDTQIVENDDVELVPTAVRGSAAAGGAVGATDASPPPAARGAPLPRGRMLIPAPRNLDIRRLAPPTSSAAASTRSRRPLLRAGVLTARRVIPRRAE